MNRLARHLGRVELHYAPWPSSWRYDCFLVSYYLIGCSFVTNGCNHLSSLVLMYIDAATHLRTAVGYVQPVELSTLNFRIPIWIPQHWKLDASSLRMPLTPESPHICLYLSFRQALPWHALTLSSKFPDFKCRSQIHWDSQAQVPRCAQAFGCRLRLSPSCGQTKTYMKQKPWRRQHFLWIFRYINHMNLLTSKFKGFYESSTWNSIYKLIMWMN